MPDVILTYHVIPFSRSLWLTSIVTESSCSAVTTDGGSTFNIVVADYFVAAATMLHDFTGLLAANNSCVQRFRIRAPQLRQNVASLRQSYWISGWGHRVNLERTPQVPYSQSFGGLPCDLHPHSRIRNVDAEHVCNCQTYIRS
jgi:hypothetical protein